MTAAVCALFRRPCFQPSQSACLAEIIRGCCAIGARRKTERGRLYRVDMGAGPAELTSPEIDTALRRRKVTASV